MCVRARARSELCGRLRARESVQALTYARGLRTLPNREEKRHAPHTMPRSMLHAEEVRAVDVDEVEAALGAHGVRQRSLARASRTIPRAKNQNVQRTRNHHDTCIDK